VCALLDNVAVFAKHVKESYKFLAPQVVDQDKIAGTMRQLWDSVTAFATQPRSAEDDTVQQRQRRHFWLGQMLPEVEYPKEIIKIDGIIGEGGWLPLSLPSVSLSVSHPSLCLLRALCFRSGSGSRVAGGYCQVKSGHIGQQGMPTCRVAIKVYDQFEQAVRQAEAERSHARKVPLPLEEQGKFSRSFASSSDARAYVTCLLREFMVMKYMVHPNILRIIGFVRDHGCCL